MTAIVMGAFAVDALPVSWAQPATEASTAPAARTRRHRTPEYSPAERRDQVGRVPALPAHAARIGLLDAVYAPTMDSFIASLRADALRLADAGRFDALLAAKRALLHRDQQTKPLAHYRDHEMARSHECFFGADEQYHHARRRFAYKQELATEPARISR